MLHPNQFNVNDAWILFQLNSALSELQKWREENQETYAVRFKLIICADRRRFVRLDNLPILPYNRFEFGIKPGAFEYHFDKGMFSWDSDPDSGRYKIWDTPTVEASD